MAIVDKLKDEIRERGGSVAGIKDIESAIKELNKLDNGGGSGGGGGVLVINATQDEVTEVITLDKTAGEIMDALANRGCYIVMEGDGIFYYYTISYVNSNYGGNGVYYFEAYAVGLDSSLELYAATEDDYPTSEEPSVDPGLG